MRNPTVHVARMLNPTVHVAHAGVVQEAGHAARQQPGQVRPAAHGAGHRARGEVALRCGPSLVRSGTVRHSPVQSSPVQSSPVQWRRPPRSRR
eukprot:7538591-Pyramimonas_sp.AAC.1